MQLVQWELSSVLDTVTQLAICKHPCTGFGSLLKVLSHHCVKAQLAIFGRSHHAQWTTFLCLWIGANTLSLLLAFLISSTYGFLSYFGRSVHDLCKFYCSFKCNLGHWKRIHSASYLAQRMPPRKHVKSCTYLVLPFQKMSADFHHCTYPLALPISQHIFDYT